MYLEKFLFLFFLKFQSSWTHNRTIFPLSMFIIAKHVTGVLDISRNGFPCADVSSTVFHTVVSHYERSKVNGGQRRVETTSDVLEERKQKSKFTVHGMCVCRYVCTKRRKIKKGRRGGEKEKEKFKESNSRRRKKERKEWKFMYISKKIYKKNLENEQRHGQRRIGEEGEESPIWKKV